MSNITNEKNESSWQQTMIEHCPIKECKGMLLQHSEHNYEKCSDCGKYFRLNVEYKEIKKRGTIMEIIKDTIIYKSDLDTFQAEQSNNKRNTERLLTREETVEVEEWLRKGILQPHKIKVVCSDKDYKVNESFIRTLTDVRKIGEICGYNQYVFSW